MAYSSMVVGIVSRRTGIAWNGIFMDKLVEKHVGRNDGDVCSECGRVIGSGEGRYQLSDAQYCVDCYGVRKVGGGLPDQEGGLTSSRK